MIFFQAHDYLVDNNVGITCCKHFAYLLFFFLFPSVWHFAFVLLVLMY